MQKLNDQQVQEALSKLSGWTLSNGEIVHDRSFRDFVQASYANRGLQKAQRVVEAEVKA